MINKELQAETKADSEQMPIDIPSYPNAAKPNVSSSVIANRRLFLSELRFGNHKKGTIKSDEKGYPVFDKEEDKHGHCCCAIMGEMFGQTETGKISLPKAMSALGLKRKDCEFIQKGINDNNSTLIENADRIESEVFKHYC